MENKGAIITRCNFQSEALDAFSQWSNSDSTPYIFLSSNKNSAVRSRFDIAHELGHLVMHRHVDRSTVYKPAEFKSIEKQAYRFAAAFLLPAESFANDLTRPTLDNFWALKERWKVSIAMMIKRCEQLNIVGEDFVPKLWINYNRRGWRKQEPLDDKLTIETPKYLRMCIEMLINEGVQSRDNIFAKLPYSSYDIEDLLGLPSGYMSLRGGSNIAYLPVLRTTKSPDMNTLRDGKVVPFKKTDDKN
jgi:Zn-dependent peptidase ImmA (M78 family)